MEENDSKNPKCDEIELQTNLENSTATASGKFQKGL